MNKVTYDILMETSECLGNATRVVRVVTMGDRRLCLLEGGQWLERLALCDDQKASFLMKRYT